MRLGIRFKQIAAVTTIVGVAVVALSVLHLRRLADDAVHDSQERGQLLINQILHRAREVVPDSPDPYAALQDDGGLRAILESSLYGESVTGAAMLDTTGTVIASSDLTLLGGKLMPGTDLGVLEQQGLLEQLRVIYSGEGQLELRQPMTRGDEAFGSIRIGVSTLLMRQELNASLRPALLTAGIALGVAVFIAAFLAQLFLRPIHVLRSGLTRLGKGEFGVTLDLPQGDEFGELGTSFNAVSQQLSADRTLLAGQKANLQSAVEHLEDAVALFNPSGELLFSNPAMEPVLPVNAIGRALSALLPEGHAYRQLVEQTLASRRSMGPTQAKLDEDAEHLLMTNAIVGTDGELVGVLLVARNIAYLSRMQSTIAYSRKLVALGRLTAGIAHEVKNPLNAMMIHLELLRTKIRKGTLAAAPTPAVEAALEHVGIIETEIRRLDEVVQGFLKFTRPEDLRLQPVSLRALFDEIVHVVQPEAESHHVKISVEIPASVPEVNGDASMLRQAFLNLAINACQAMPEGGTLRLVCAPASRDRVEIRVEDTGVGIPPDHLGKIFDLYFTTKDHGTGIGLSMVFRIVQMHDGEIEVQSTPGKGTTFRMLLPRASEV